MLTLRTGTLTIRKGRLTVGALRVESGATLRNDAEVYTTTTVSDGVISGTGTLWAHVSSRPIGGEIFSTQIIIYWPVDKRLVLPICYGGLVCIPKATGDGELT